MRSGVRVTVRVTVGVTVRVGVRVRVRVRVKVGAWMLVGRGGGWRATRLTVIDGVDVGGRLE